MSARMRFALAVVVLGLLMTGPFVLTAALIWIATEGAERDTLLQTIAPHLPLGTLVTAFGFGLGVVVVRDLFRHYVKGLERLGEQLRLMLGANRNLRVTPSGPPEVQAVVAVANELAEQRDAMMADVEAQIAAFDPAARAPCLLPEALMALLGLSPRMPPLRRAPIMKTGL